MEKTQSPKRNSNFVKYLVVGLSGFVFGLIVFGAVNFVLTSTANKNQLDTTLLFRVQSILEQKFDGEIDTKKQSEGAVAGSVAALGDPYTVYLDERTAN